MRRRASAVRRTALVAALAASTGCAGLWPTGSVAPNGLARSDDDLRRDLVAARYLDALERVTDEDEAAAPEDELLRLLYRGMVAHYAGRYAESAAALDRAAALADDRYTLSASRGALSLLSSDRALQFRPSRTERLLIHYYAALDYLQLADVDGAAVEARRLSALLQRYRDDGWDCGGTDLCPAMRYFAGAVFEAAGLHGDADVAYRNAGAMVDRIAPPERDSASDPTDDIDIGTGGEADTAGSGPEAAAPGAPGEGEREGGGEVVLVLERGFVAHRVQESATVVLTGEESVALQEADDDERLALSSLIAARLLGDDDDVADGPPIAAAGADRRAADPPRGRRPTAERRSRDDDEEGSDDDEEDEDDDVRNPYLLRVAWPVYRDEYEPRGRVQLVGPGGRRAEVPALADVSTAVMEEFEGDRLAIVARAVARAATKMATVRAVETEVAGGSALGRVLGLLTNIGGALLEQADTRSWHLLPDAIGVARMRLPAGRHTLELRLSEERDRDARRVPIGPVEVRTGAITFVSARVWR